MDIDNKSFNSIAAFRHNPVFILKYNTEKGRYII